MRKTDSLIFVSTFIIFPLIYILPFVLTYLKLPFSPLPLDFSSDVYMYLNYTQLPVGDNGLTQNPWYHTEVPAAQLVYLKYGLLNLFTWLNSLFSSLALTLIVWNWLWAAITFVCASLFFREIADNKSAVFIVFGIALLFFFQVSDLPQYIRGLTHLSFDPDVLLPLQRTFFPQVAIPLLFLYLYFLFKAFQDGRLLYWILLFLIQYVAFVNFPYNTVVMGIVTFFVILFALFSKEGVPWKYLILFAVAVIAADLAFLMNGSSSGSGGSHHRLLDIDFSRIHEIFGGTNIVLFLLTAITFVLPEKRKIVKYTVAAAGLGTLSLQFSDLIFNPNLQLTHHFAYFTQKIIAILLFYIAVKVTDLIPLRDKLLASIAGGITILLVATGVLSAKAQADAKLAHHLESYTTYETLQQLNASSKDLLIAPSLTVNDTATWLPLLFKSEVLFSRNSEFLLPGTEKGKSIYWQREATYLYLRGIDTKALHHILFAKDGSDSSIQKIIQVGQRFDLHTSRRDKMLKDVFAALSKYLQPLEKDPESLKRFFSRYERVIVIDRLQHPLFTNLQPLGTPAAVEKADDIVIRVYTPS